MERDGLDSIKAAEVMVERHEMLGPVLETDGGDLSVESEVASGIRLPSTDLKQVEKTLSWREDTQRRTAKHSIQRIERLVKRGRRREYLWMGYHTNEFPYAKDGEPPGFRSLGDSS